MNFYYKILLVFLGSFTVICQGLFAIDVDLIRDEDFIPFYAELNQTVETEIGRLTEGERVVVIRPDSSYNVRIEAPRKGIVTLPVEVTNLAVEIARAKSGDDSNFRKIPRMSFFLANRIMSGGSFWQNPVHADLIYSCKRWILLYGDAREEDTQSAVISASKYYEDLSPFEYNQTMFVYMDVPGNKVEVQKLADSESPKIHSMPGYLSKGYVTSLDHVEDDFGFPQLVELAASGRILARANGLQEITAWLNR